MDRNDSTKTTAPKHPQSETVDLSPNASDYRVKRCGEMVADDGLQIDMPRSHADQAWGEIPLPACPDCGGDLVWDEAGHVPGTRRCAGLPVGGRITSTLDARIAHVLVNPPPHLRDVVQTLVLTRNECPDSEVDTVDDMLLAELMPYAQLSYPSDGGCGSLFSVQCDKGRVFLRRERVHS